MFNDNKTFINYFINYFKIRLNMFLYCSIENCNQKENKYCNFGGPPKKTINKRYNHKNDRIAYFPDLSAFYHKICVIGLYSRCVLLIQTIRTLYFIWYCPRLTPVSCPNSTSRWYKAYQKEHKCDQQL